MVARNIDGKAGLRNQTLCTGYMQWCLKPLEYVNRWFGSHIYLGMVPSFACLEITEATGSKTIAALKAVANFFGVPDLFKAKSVIFS